MIAIRSSWVIDLDGFVSPLIASPKGPRKPTYRRKSLLCAACGRAFRGNGGRRTCSRTCHRAVSQ